MAGIGAEGNLSRLLSLFTVLKGTLCGICTGQQQEVRCPWTMTLSSCLVLSEMKPQVRFTGGFLNKHFAFSQLLVFAPQK